MTSVLITDGEQRSALAAARSLGRAGHRVYVCSGAWHSLAGASRYVTDEAAVPDPLDRPRDFVPAIERLLDRWRIDMIMPMADPSILPLHSHRERFHGVTLLLPHATAYRRISNKALVLDIAQRIGIAVPSRRLLLDASDAGEALPPETRFPVVVKPVRSIGEAGDRRVRVGVSYARDEKELANRLNGLPAGAYPVLIQERIVGPALGVFLLLWNDELLAVFCHRRLREKPPSGGVSVYRESVPADQVLVARSRSLLSWFGWQGVAMIEYKLDATTGNPYLMEVNGRFWGSLQLAIDAGVDFPAMLAMAADGHSPAPVRDYRTGVRSRWWWGDIDHLLIRLRHSRDDLALPPDAPSRTRAIFDFLKVWRPGNKSEVFRLHDARPFLRESVYRLVGR